jgi:predicted hotdog family 3-hydroxylacyl-ACP dehydratase
MSAVIFQDEIRELIPHAGRMCLWQSVEHWDAQSIRCQTLSHRDALNPLRCNQQLSAIHLAEYGAQAVAIHGGLIARAARTAPAASGMLAALRDFFLNVQRLDDIEHCLTVSARPLVVSSTGSIYEFVIEADRRPLAGGRVSVVIASTADVT